MGSNDKKKTTCRSLSQPQPHKPLFFPLVAGDLTESPSPTYLTQTLNPSSSSLTVLHHSLTLDSTMADAIVDLLRALKKSEVNLTKEEYEVIRAQQAKLRRDGIVAAGIGGSVAWMVTRNLDKASRAAFTGGAGFQSWKWGMRWSCNSVVEQILAMDGSRLQHEMTKIMLQKYANDPGKRKLLSKYFYTEQVFDDSSSDRPISVFRKRNTYVDEAVHGQDFDRSHSDEVGTDMNRRLMNNDPETSRETTSTESRQVQVTPTPMFVDPFESLLGSTQAIERLEIPSPPAKAKGSHGTRNRNRHRKRHHAGQDHVDSV
ncbi:hypothetical protein AKJ16_DCAP05844 [Drosera capensis]